MAFPGKCGSFKAFFGMAKVAFVGVGLRGKLSAVGLSVTRVADQFACSVPGIATLGLMALGARQRRVFPYQRECALHVGGAVKERRLETRRVVA
jgi:hypothetical protein